ncbi:MAG: 6-phosphogluconolactonase, partial [Calditrichaeota bacterium]
MKIEFKTFKDKNSLGAFAADWLLEFSNRIIGRKGVMNIALSGGSTPRIMYNHLVLSYPEELKWDYLDFFWSDERYDALSHPDSNAGMALKYLLQPLNIDREHYFPMPTSYPMAVQSAMEYEDTLRSYFGVPVGIPSFDLMILGLGSDGHTASLFPGSKALDETRRLVVGNWIESLQNWRLTFTFPLLNAAQQIVFLVSGSDKAQVVREILKYHNTQ